MTMDSRRVPRVSRCETLSPGSTEGDVDPAMKPPAKEDLQQFLFEGLAGIHRLVELLLGE